MHPEAYAGARRQLVTLYGDLTTASPRVLDVGGRNVNGTIHDLLPHAKWTVLDSMEGPDVDLVLDATKHTFETQDFDLVVCTEVLEHVDAWGSVIRCCRSAASQLVLTCASTGRQPHGAWGDPSPGPGEWYRNVAPDVLMNHLTGLYANVHVEYHTIPGDAYVAAWS